MRLVAPCRKGIRRRGATGLFTSGERVWVSCYSNSASTRGTFLRPSPAGSLAGSSREMSAASSRATARASSTASWTPAVSTAVRRRSRATSRSTSLPSPTLTGVVRAWRGTPSRSRRLPGREPSDPVAPERGLALVVPAAFLAVPRRIRCRRCIGWCNCVRRAERSDAKRRDRINALGYDSRWMSELAGGAAMDWLSRAATELPCDSHAVWSSTMKTSSGTSSTTG